MSKYAHIHKAFITIEQLRWTRISVGADGHEHPHSFYRDGDDKRITKVEVSLDGPANHRSPDGQIWVSHGAFVSACKVDASAGKDKLVGKVTSGIADLLGKAFCLKFSQRIIHCYPVLKTSGSSFENFFKDEYTTLVPVNDRIFSTSVDLSYIFSPVQLSSPKDDKKLEFVVPDGANLAGGAWDGIGVAERARKVTLEVFATDDSASVQVCTNLRSN